MMSKSKSIIIILLAVIFFQSCKKEVVNLTNSTTKEELWVKFLGDYKVYDTLGVFLYNMKISFKEFQYADSSFGKGLLITNFDNNFDLHFLYSNQSPDDFIPIPFFDSIKGNHDLKTWQIYGQGGGVKNRLVGDTLNLFFTKTNIKYYFKETIPYYYCDCKQIAVKQH